MKDDTIMLDVVKIQEILPHRYPFLLIDRVIDVLPKDSIRAYKNVTCNEEIFQGHFPGHPIYPGVMIIEGLAQAGGLLAFESLELGQQESTQDKVVYFMSIDKAKFRSPVTPGDRLEYRVSILKNKGKVWFFDAKAYVDDKLAAQAELKAMITDK